VAVVTFDVDSGQTPVYSYPAGGLTEAELKAIAYLALPDSNTSVLQDLVYAFRVRSDSLPLFASTPLHHAYTYGAAFFRQRRDAAVRRGYVQTSVVALSPAPFTALLKSVARMLGRAYFDMEAGGGGGEAALAAGWEDVRRWPPLVSGATLDLPLLGGLLSFTVPWVGLDAYRPRQPRAAVADAAAAAVAPAAVVGAPAHAAAPALVARPPAARSVSLADAAAAKSVELPGLFQDVGLYSVFRSLTPSLWHLWELAITGAPILVTGPSPEVAGDAVFAIVSLVSPLEYCADFRPYFTLYDADYEAIVAASGTHSASAPRHGLPPPGAVVRGPPRPPALPTVPPVPAGGGGGGGGGGGRGRAAAPLLLGTTNPFFVKALEAWPNAVWLGAHPTRGVGGVAGTRPAARDGDEAPASLRASAGGGGSGGGGGRGYTLADVKTRIIGDGESLAAVLPSPGQETSSGAVFVMRRKPALQPDAGVLSQLLRVRPGDEMGRQLRICTTPTAATAPSPASGAARRAESAPPSAATTPVRPTVGGGGGGGGGGRGGSPAPSPPPGAPPAPGHRPQVFCPAQAAAAGRHPPRFPNNPPPPPPLPRPPLPLPPPP